MLPSVSMVVRVSRRRSVTMLPLVVIVLSVNVRETLPFSFVTIAASDDLLETSLLPHDVAAPRSAIAANDVATAPTAFIFRSFMAAPPFLLFFCILLPLNNANYTAVV